VKLDLLTHPGSYYTPVSFARENLRFSSHSLFFHIRRFTFARHLLVSKEPDIMASSSAAAGLLARQLKQMQNDKSISGISCGLVDNNVFEWEVMLMIDDDTKFYGGGFFRARLTFPSEYPLLPPKMRFETPIFHPNIYPNGDVCISILHPPEEDKYGYESAAERWSPVQTPETILLSVISMLSSPNDESPANVEAARLWREDPAEFKKRVRKCVRASLEE
jgi:ubiquitin-conjugating enzyme E2 G1